MGVAGGTSEVLYLRRWGWVWGMRRLFCSLCLRGDTCRVRWKGLLGRVDRQRAARVSL